MSSIPPLPAITNGLIVSFSVYSHNIENYRKLAGGWITLFYQRPFVAAELDDLATEIARDPFMNLHVRVGMVENTYWLANPSALPSLSPLVRYTAVAHHDSAKRLVVDRVIASILVPCFRKREPMDDAMTRQFSYRSKEGAELGATHLTRCYEVSLWLSEDELAQYDPQSAHDRMTKYSHRMLFDRANIEHCLQRFPVLCDYIVNFLYHRILPTKYPAEVRAMTVFFTSSEERAQACASMRTETVVFK